MAFLPHDRPKQLSLGPLEAEILGIVWQMGSATVKDVHEQILADPDRELAYASVNTVLKRLAQKGWLTCNRQDRQFRWQPRISQQQAQVLQAYEQLNQFLAIGNPDVVAAFADELDQASVAQLEAITQRLQSIRDARKKDTGCT
jgi:predicted transcriptional regulator